MKTITRSLQAILVLTALSVTVSAADTREKLFLVINYSVHHCNIDIELNGVQMTKTDKNSAYSTTGFSTGAGLWIMPGKNTISLRVRPMEKPADSGDRPSVEISLSTVTEGQMTNEGKKFFELKIPEKDNDTRLDNVTKPFTVTKTFTPAYAPPSELWGKIKTVKIDDAARAEITRLAKDYHAALSRKDADAVWTILQFASMDSARIRHQPADELKAQFTKVFKGMMADRNFKLLPLDAGKLAMKPVADGKVIQVTDQSGNEPIRTKETRDGGAYTFGVFAGNIDGKWIIVR
ncbi:MAG: hypothetical protein KA369_05065 [Spirochaetes bacterium]|nr:hypothetical protein [Spirochaetota bacterium]